VGKLEVLGDDSHGDDCACDGSPHDGHAASGDAVTAVGACVGHSVSACTGRVPMLMLLMTML